MSEQDQPADPGQEYMQELANRPRRRRVDWYEAERAYVQGTEIDGELVFPSHQDIAGRFGADRRQVAYHSKEKRWVAKREDYRTRFALQHHRKNLRARVARAEKFEGGNLEVAEGLQALAKVVMNETVREFRDSKKTPSVSQLKELAHAVAVAQRVGRVAMGLPTDIAMTARSLRDEDAAAIGIDDERRSQMLSLELDPNTLSVEELRLLRDLERKRESPQMLTDGVGR